jgi:hypothetical protein
MKLNQKQIVQNAAIASQQIVRLQSAISQNIADINAHNATGGNAPIDLTQLTGCQAHIDALSTNVRAHILENSAPLPPNSIPAAPIPGQRPAPVLTVLKSPVLAPPAAAPASAPPTPSTPATK